MKNKQALLNDIITQALQYNNIHIGVFAPTYKQVMFVNHKDFILLKALEQGKILKIKHSYGEIHFKNGSKIHFVNMEGNRYECIMGSEYPLIYLIDVDNLSKEAKMWSVLRNRLGEFRNYYPDFEPKVYIQNETTWVEADKERLIENITHRR